MMAITNTEPAPAPAPWMNRQVSRAVRVPEMAHPTPATRNTPQPMSSRGRRPYRSDSGPYTRGPSAKPSMKRLSDRDAPAEVVPRVWAMSESAGRPMSMERGGSALSVPSSRGKANELGRMRMAGCFPHDPTRGYHQAVQYGGPRGCGG